MNNLTLPEGQTSFNNPVSGNAAGINPGVQPVDHKYQNFRKEDEHLRGIANVLLLNTGFINLLDQWYRSDHLSRTRFTDDHCLVDAGEVSQAINTESLALMKMCEVIGTPTFFINGYKLPSQYDIDDIKYFSEIFNITEVLT